VKPGDLVRISPLTDKPRYRKHLGVIIEEQRGTGLYRVMLMGEENNNRIFRYSSVMLKKVEDE